MRLSYIVTLLLPLLAVGWWDVGHMLTAAIADARLKELNPYAAIHFKELVESINHLVDEKSRTFIESACWPDDIKYSQYNMHLWDAWHFIDNPYVANGVFPQINFTEAVLNAVNVMDQAHHVLSRNIDKNTAERALFARYLVHLVGDIHQPLHAVALYNKTYPKGDAGGNFIKVTLLNGTTGYNLHKFWDSGALRVQNDSYEFPRPLSLSQTTQLRAYAKSLMNEYGKAVEESGRILDPAKWAIESLEAAQQHVYAHLAHTDVITQEYSDSTFEVSKKRITLAGYRLANYVINIYDPQGKHSSHPRIILYGPEASEGSKEDRCRKIQKRLSESDL